MTLSPLGIFSAAGAGGIPDSSFEWIATGNGTGSSAFVEFTSIPSTYTHLQIRGTFRTTDNSTQNLFITMNGVGGTSYSRHNLNGNLTNVQVTQQTSQARIQIDAVVSGALQGAGIHGALVMDIVDYKNTARNKTARILSGFIGSGLRSQIDSGLFINTAAITTIRLAASVGSLTTSSRFSLYGIRG